MCVRVCVRAGAAVGIVCEPHACWSSCCLCAHRPGFCICDCRLVEHAPHCTEASFLSLLPAPAAGVKYPLRWIQQIKAKSTDKAQWRVLVDAAAYVPTQPLDLRKVNPDFVSLSFYKMFGYPTVSASRHRTQRAWEDVCTLPVSHSSTTPAMS